MSKILVVDDDLTVRKICSGVLKQKGYKVLVASGGEEALSILKKTQVDAIILDLIMPGISGFEVFEKIRDLSKKIFVIILTGVEITEEIEKLGNGTACVMAKGDGIGPVVDKIDERLKKGGKI
ncbi:MAG: response regulator [Elusimicrobiota bacterium]|nr:response regulator [Elusimicrobiota bacterium]